MSKQTIKINLSPFPTPVNVKIEQKIYSCSIEVNETVPSPFAAPDKTYVHTQHEYDDTWVIVHNMNKFPTVALVDEEGYSITGVIKFISSDTIEAQFSEPVKGQAFLN